MSQAPSLYAFLLSLSVCGCRVDSVVNLRPLVELSCPLPNPPSPISGPAYMKPNMAQLQKLGLRVAKSAINTDKSVEENANIIRGEVLDAPCKVVLIGHSKVCVCVCVCVCFGRRASHTRSVCTYVQTHSNIHAIPPHHHSTTPLLHHPPLHHYTSTPLHHDTHYTATTVPIHHSSYLCL
jgi:hypothetical protein